MTPFAQPLFLWLTPLAVAGAAALFYWSWRVKQKLTRQFIGARLLKNLTVGVSPARQKFRLSLLVAAVGLMFLALARPQWNYAYEEAKQQGLDIIIAMDTSRSMLARDVVPDRLEKAKLAAYDLMKLAKSDRLGLVAFAGTAFLQSPLTLDDVAFRQGLDALSVGIVPQGGTALSAAIRTALGAFEKHNDNHKVLVLFTDGEDHDAEADTLAAAKEAAEAGMHIFTIGVGTPEGELLQVRDEHGNYSFVKDDDGNVVKSRLNKALLEQIATIANGFYLPLQGANPMETLYARGLAPLPKGQETTRLTKVYQEKFYWFLGLAILCLVVEFLLPERPRTRRQRVPTSKSRAPLQTAALLALCLMPLAGRSSPSGAYKDYQSGNYKGAYDEFNRLAEKNTNDYRLHYDAGAAAYNAKRLQDAEKQFNATLTTPSVAADVPTQEHTYYNLGNTEYHLGEALEPDKKQERWNQAINHYLQALRLNTNDIEARNNLAYVKQKLEQLKQQQQQQQKQQNQQNQNQQQKNQQQQGQQDQQKQQQQKQQSGQQEQQQQSAQEKQKEEQQKQEQAQAQQEKQKQEQQQAQSSPGEQKDKSQEEQQQAAAGEMTPDEARQILAQQKEEEKPLIFMPDNNQQSKTQPGKFKDW